MTRSTSLHGLLIVCLLGGLTLHTSRFTSDAGAAFCSPTNFGKVTASTGYSSSATTVVLNTGDGARLPAPSGGCTFPLTWFNATDYSDPADDPSREIVSVTARTGDTLTIVRGQEGTSPAAHNTGGKTYKLVLAFTQAQWDELKTSGGEVTLTGAQTLTNKTLTAPTITAAILSGLKQFTDNVKTVEAFATADLCAAGTGAIDQIGAVTTTLVITTAATCTLDKTTPANLLIAVVAPGSLTISSGKTLTVQGGWLAPDTHILNGPGVVRFRNSGLSAVPAIWWGLTLDNTGDNTASLQAAIDATTQYSSTTFPMKLVLPRGRIRYATTLTVGATGTGAGMSAWMEGPGLGNFQSAALQSPIQNNNYETTLNYVGSGIAVKTRVSRIKMGGFILTSDTDGAGTTTATGGLQVGDSGVSGEASYNSFSDMAISNFKATNAWGAAPHATVGQYGTYWQNVSFNGNYDNYYASESGGGFNTHTTFMNCAFQRAVRYGFHKPAGGTHHSHYFYSPLFQHNGADAIHVDGGQGLYRLFAPYFEANNKDTAGYTVEFDGQASIIATPGSYIRSSAMFAPIFISPGANTTGELFLRQTKDFTFEAVGGSLNEPMRIELSGRNPGFTRIPYDQTRSDLGLLLGQLGLHFGSNLKAAWGFVAKYGDSVTNAVPDWSGNSNHVSLVDGAATIIDEDFDPWRSNGGSPLALFFGGAREWEAADHASLSATSGGFSIVALVRPVTKTSRTIVAKYDDAGKREYRLYLDASGRVNWEVWDESAGAKLARYAASTSYLTLFKWHVLVATYSGGTTDAALAIYGMKDSEAFPSRIDDTNNGTGTFVAMEDLSAKVGNYVTLSGAKAQKSDDDQALVMLVGEELTFAKVKAITALLAHYAGIAPPTNVP